MTDMRCEYDIEFVETLREYQSREGITNAELARRIGMHPPDVSRLFSDDYEGSVKLKTVFQAYRRIGVKLNWDVEFPSREKIPA